MSESINTNKFACSLTDPEFRQRRTFIRKKLLRHISKAEKYESGIRICFPNTLSIRKDLDELVTFETQCCAFLSFDITSKESDLILTIDGPSAANETLTMFAKGLGINQ